MSEPLLRYFDAIHKPDRYRVYLTDSSLLCVNLGQLPAVQGTGMAAAQAYQEAVESAKWQWQQAAERLGKRNAEGIQIYIKANKCGYVFNVDDLDEVRIGYVNRWKRLFFVTPDPAVIVRHPKHGRHRFIPVEKADVVVALYELQELYGDVVEVDIDVSPYKKALKKYEKLRNS
jgi:hypothetical protein